VNEDAALVRERVKHSLLFHPRVAYQEFFVDAAKRADLAERLPNFVAFGGKRYHEVMPVLDWDHRLPSKFLVLRIYAYYEPASYAEGRRSYDTRTEEIDSKDRYPEFDVPDYEGLFADEAYEIVIDVATGSLDRPRLVSEWRRNVPDDVALAAVETVRASKEFHSAMASCERERDLGDLEAVCWAAPCEADAATWCVDVWFLVAFDGFIARGFSFMVDPAAKELISAREFVARASLAP